MNKISQLNLLDEKAILPHSLIHEYTAEQLTCLVPSNDKGKTYCLGFLDGSVRLLNSIDLRLVGHVKYPGLDGAELVDEEEDSSQDWTSVTDICADENLLAIVRHNGLLTVYQRSCDEHNHDCEEKFKSPILKEKFESPLLSVKITSDSRFVVVFCQDRIDQMDQKGDEHIEFLSIYDCSVAKHPEFIGRVPLNLDDNQQYTEDPAKMFKLKDDNSTMLLRSDDMLGLHEVSLDNCRLTDAMEKLHKKPILDFLVLSDQQTVVTASRDREMCIWNFQRKLLIERIEDHESAVTCLAVSKDEQFLFSGSDKGEVIVFMVDGWLKLCTLSQNYVPLSFDRL